MQGFLFLIVLLFIIRNEQNNRLQYSYNNCPIKAPHELNNIKLSPNSYLWNQLDSMGLKNTNIRFENKEEIKKQYVEYSEIINGLEIEDNFINNNKYKSINNKEYKNKPYDRDSYKAKNINASKEEYSIKKSVEYNELVNNIEENYSYENYEEPKKVKNSKDKNSQYAYTRYNNQIKEMDKNILNEESIIKKCIEYNEIINKIEAEYIFGNYELSEKNNKVYNVDIIQDDNNKVKNTDIEFVDEKSDIKEAREYNLILDKVEEKNKDLPKNKKYSGKSIIEERDEIHREDIIRLNKKKRELERADNIINVKSELLETIYKKKKESIGEILKSMYIGARVSVFIASFGIVSGEVVFNIESIVALKTEEDIIIFVNEDDILSFL